MYFWETNHQFVNDKSVDALWKVEKKTLTLMYFDLFTTESCRLLCTNVVYCTAGGLSELKHSRHFFIKTEFSHAAYI